MLRRKNFFCRRYETLLLTEKNLCKYSGFQKGHRSFYMVFMNYMKNSLLSNFKWLVSWKVVLPKPKVSYECLFTSPTQKSCDEKVLDCPDVPEGLLRVLIRFHNGRVFFTFLSDGILLRVLSDRTVLLVLIERVFFESPCSYSGSAVIYSSLGSYSALFQACCYFFIKTCYYFFN